MIRKPPCIIYIVVGKEERYQCTEPLTVQSKFASLNALSIEKIVSSIENSK